MPRRTIRYIYAASATLLFAVIVGITVHIGYPAITASLLGGVAAVGIILLYESRRRSVQLSKVVHDYRATQRQFERLSERNAEAIEQLERTVSLLDETLQQQVRQAELRLFASFETERLRTADRHYQILTALRSSALSPQTSVDKAVSAPDS